MTEKEIVKSKRAFDMPAKSRIDVDGAYESRILHYARVNQELFPARDSLVYLEPCKEVTKDLNERGIKTFVFFQPFTVPNKDFAQELLKKDKGQI
jgi:hypothetical protein